MELHLLQSLNPKLQILQLPRPPSPPLPLHSHPQTPSPSPSHSPLIKCTCKLSRRDLSVSTASSTSLLLLSTFLFSPSPSLADSGDDALPTTAADSAAAATEEDTITALAEPESVTTTATAEQDSTTTSATSSSSNSGANYITNTATTTTTTNGNGNACIDQKITKKAFLDVAVDGQPAGRIIVGLYGDGAPVGSSRFAALVSGAAGISYRRKEFVKIVPNYIQHGGVRSYGGDAELAKRAAGAGGDAPADKLVAEWEASNRNCPGAKNVAGALGLVVRDPARPPPKMKLVARNGKLEIDQEEVGVAPNGTEFVIAVKDSPELDESTLVIGKVLDGMDVVEKISQAKTVKDNTSSPYFRIAKLIGDNRAVVAERGFNRPYSKIVVTNCGLLE